MIYLNLVTTFYFKSLFHVNSSSTRSMDSFLWRRGEFFQGDDMIHGVHLLPDYHRISIDFVMDGCRYYNLPYETDAIDV
jgi:hypothetical protein